MSDRIRLIVVGLNVASVYFRSIVDGSHPAAIP